MAKRKDQIQNTEPFNPYGANPAKTNKRSKAPKPHQQEEQFIAPKLSSKIMKQALIQQKEEEKEETHENNATPNLFKEVPNFEVEGGDDIDDFVRFSESHSQFAEYDEEINEEYERLMEAFISMEPSQQKTLADLIVQRIKEKDASVA